LNTFATAALGRFHRSVVYGAGRSAFPVSKLS